MSTTYPEVELYQINCSQDRAGESAIMLLIDDPKKVSPKLTAVLIDAGLSNNAVKLLVMTMKEIEVKYAIIDGLKFDAVVISHWDQDHWLGLAYSFSWSLIANGDFGWNHITNRMKCFKYDSSGASQTHLYAPIGPPSSGRFNATYLAWSNTSTPQTINFVPSGQKGYPSYPWAIAHIDSEKTVIGTNIFTGLGTTADLKDILNAEELITDNPPDKMLLHAPGLYIVGANQKVIGPEKLTVVDRKQAGTAGESNATSLLLLLIWDRGNIPAISFYSGGDAEFERENALVDWIDPYRVTCVKAGHHGSRAGTSINFVKNVYPSHYIMSAARQYGHPVPEIVWYLDAWFSTDDGSLKDKNGNVLATKRIHGTCFPYWLGIVQPDSTKTDLRFIDDKSVNLDSFALAAKVDVPMKEYQENVKGLYLDPADNPMVLAAAAYTNFAGKKSEQKMWVQEKLFEMWDKWSDVTYASFPLKIDENNAKKKYYKLDTWITAPLQYVKVTFTCGDSASSADAVVKLQPVKSSSGTKNFTSDEQSNKRQKIGLSKSKLIASTAKNSLGMTLRSGKVYGFNQIMYVLTLGEETRILENALTGDPNPYIFEDAGLNNWQADAMNTDLEIAKGKETSSSLVSDPSDPAPIPDSFGWVVPVGIVSPQDYDDSGILYLEEPAPDTAPPQNMFDFVSNLHQSYLKINTPNSFNSDGVWEQCLSVDDELQRWLEAFFRMDNNSPSPGCRLFPWGHRQNSPSLYGFDLRVSTVGTWDLSFKSEPVVASWSLALDPANPPHILTEVLTTELDPQGLSSGVRLMLTLDKRSDISQYTLPVTFTDLFSLASITIPVYFGLINSWTFALDTSQGTVNAFWFAPSPNYATDLHMRFLETSSGLNGWLNGVLGDSVALKPCKVFVTRTASYSDSGRTSYIDTYGSMSLHTSMSIGTSPDWDLYVGIRQQTVELVFQWNHDESDLSDFISWVFEKAGATSHQETYKAVTDKFKKKTKSGNSLNLRQASMDFVMDDSSWSVTEFTLDFEADLDWGIDPQNPMVGSAVPILLVFSWLGSPGTDNFLFRFEGRLWPFLSDYAWVRQLLSPEAQPFPPLSPMVQNPQYFFSLRNLPGLDPKMQFPNGIPDMITYLSLEISTDPNTDDILFDAVLSTSQPTDTICPVFTLSELTLRASYSANATQGSSNTQVNFTALVNLRPRSGDFMGIAIFSNLSYDSGLGQWSLLGRAENFNLACLHSLFPEADRGSVMNLIEEIKIPYFEMEYSYNSKGLGQSFSACGTILLGPVELDLSFEYPADSKWSFSATLKVDREEDLTVNFGDFLESVSAELDQLPRFIKNMRFSVAKSSSAASHDTSAIHEDMITLKCAVIEQGYTLLSIDAKVEEFDFTFIQITNGTFVKRVLKFTVDGLPNLEIPLVNHFEQPYDQMDFLWVLTFVKSGTSDPIPNGLAAAEIEAINRHVYTDDRNKIVYKVPAEKTPQPSSVPMIVSGPHFMVVVQENNVPTCILDYTFTEEGTLDSNEEDIKTSTTASADLTKTTGPLTLSSIGLKYHQGQLQILLNAQVRLGAIQCALNGFSIGFPVDKIQKFTVTSAHILGDVMFHVDGIGLELNDPPLRIAGTLIDKDDSYSGGVSIQFEEYNFLVDGFYGKESLHGSDFKTMFVFGRLGGPLIELEFATLSDITGGFGHNSEMTIPSATQVPQFPFLRNSIPHGGTKDVFLSFLQDQPPYFGPKVDSLWIAAGLTGTAFQVLEISAVVVVTLDNSVILGVFADCTASVPDFKKSNNMFARAEMGLLAVVDFGKGVFQVEGQLTPRSFVLDPNCHLTGGFALCYWFTGSGHEGDWVFTIGGFHSAFKIPEHYPLVPRVGISWQFGKHVSISGNAYFAITPKVAMGGGCLKLLFELGGISAHYDAWADFLINYEPFFFVADVGVTVGVAYTMRVGHISKHFGINYGAQVHLAGPPISGYVRINWIIISFDIYFGRKADKPKALHWSEFKALLSGSSNETVEVGESAATDDAQMLTLSPSTGIISGQDQEIWVIDGSSFAFFFNTLFPISSCTLNDQSVVLPNVDPTYSKPMQLSTALASSVSLTVVSTGQNAMVAYFKPVPITKLVPLALWDKYDEAKDPSSVARSNDLLDPTNSTTLKVMGIQLLNPDPIESTTKDPDDFLDLNVATGISASVFSSPDPPKPNDPLFPRLPIGDETPQYYDENDTLQQVKDRTSAPQKTSLDKALNVWNAPVPGKDTYEVTQAWKNLNNLKLSSIIDAWEVYSGARTGTAAYDRMDGILRAGNSVVPQFVSVGEDSFMINYAAVPMMVGIGILGVS